VPLSGCHQLSHLLECTEHCGVHNIQPTECTVFFLWYLYCNITEYSICFNPKVCKWPVGHSQESISLIQLFYKDFTTWLFYTVLCIKIVSLVLYNIIWSWFPDGDSLWIETC
jgi:hypothetical protein